MRYEALGLGLPSKICTIHAQKRLHDPVSQLTLQSSVVLREVVIDPTAAQQELS